MNPVYMYNPSDYMSNSSVSTYYPSLIASTNGASTKTDYSNSSPSRVLMLSVISDNQSISVEDAHAICSIYGVVLRIVLFTKSHCKILIEYLDSTSVQLALRNLQRKHVYSTAEGRLLVTPSTFQLELAQMQLPSTLLPLKGFAILEATQSINPAPLKIVANNDRARDFQMFPQPPSFLPAYVQPEDHNTINNNNNNNNNVHMNNNNNNNNSNNSNMTNNIFGLYRNNSSATTNTNNNTNAYNTLDSASTADLLLNNITNTMSNMHLGTTNVLSPNSLISPHASHKSSSNASEHTRSNSMHNMNALTGLNLGTTTNNNLSGYVPWHTQDVDQEYLVSESSNSTQSSTHHHHHQNQRELVDMMGQNFNASASTKSVTRPLRPVSASVLISSSSNNSNSHATNNNNSNHNNNSLYNHNTQLHHSYAEDAESPRSSMATGTMFNTTTYNTAPNNPNSLRTSYNASNIALSTSNSQLQPFQYPALSHTSNNTSNNNNFMMMNTNAINSAIISPASMHNVLSATSMLNTRFLIPLSPPLLRHVLWVTEIPALLATPYRLSVLFGVYGNVLRARVAPPMDNVPSYQALIVFSTAEEAERAKMYLQGFIFMSTPLVVMSHTDVAFQHILSTNIHQCYIDDEFYGTYQQHPIVTGDFSTCSATRRYVGYYSKNMKHICSPNYELHVSNMVSPNTIQILVNYLQDLNHRYAIKNNNNVKMDYTLSDDRGLNPAIPTIPVLSYRAFNGDGKMGFLKFENSLQATLALVLIHNQQLPSQQKGKEQFKVKVSFAHS